MKHTNRVYGLVDCNSFYASCERIFRPDLNNKPVIVLSNNDGCAIARTKEAKDLGIKMGEPYFKIKRLCQKHDVHIFSSNFSLYIDISNRVMKTLMKMCPSVEVYSVDEAFVDLSGIQNVEEFGHEIKRRILQDIGIPVGVGIARTKVLAKLANNIAKKSTKADGVVSLLSPRHLDYGLKLTQVEDIWGIGRASSQKLRALGIANAYDFREYQNEKLIQKTLTKVGLQIKHEIMGINCFGFSDPIQDKKEIMCSRTFGTKVIDKKSLKESISNYVCDAAKKLRAQNSLCTTISVFARTNAYSESPQYYMFETKKLHNPTNDTRKLLQAALELVDKGFVAGFEYQKAGVKISNFSGESGFQLDIFYPHDTQRDRDLMHVIDKINYREGDGSVRFLACGVDDSAFRMNRRFKSPRYTTSWGELCLF